jgi:UDP-2,3-diacylglucosamine pyrophosphatase LpxH
MRIHVLSDLHLEHDPDWRPPQVDADALVLAGDIDAGLRGMAKFTRHGKRVLYVPGNHEYFGENMGGLGAAMRLYSKACGVTLLDSDEAVIDGVRFLGTTLWTDFELFGADKLQLAQAAADRYMNDYICINSGSKGCLTPADALAMHKKAVAWLEQKLDQPFEGPTVVITHHAPHPRSIDAAHARKMMAAAFASDLTRLMGKPQVWIHGHVHHSFDYEVNGTRILSNPKGYGQENRDFQPDYVLTIPRITPARKAAAAAAA